MGLRACALKKREIELGDHSVLNYQSILLEAVISEYCEDAFTGADFGDISCTWEVQKDEFKDMIDSVEALTDEEFETKFGGKSMDPDNTVTRTIMVDALKKLYEDGIQAGDDYIFIVWV